MKREIKFRAWFPEQKRVTPSKSLRELIEIAIRVGEPLQDSLVIMQYTGLKDKYGNEIYEGDVVDCTGTRYICQWNGNRAEWAWVTLERNYIYPIGDCRTELVIIGNIYENPNLINP